MKKDTPSVDKLQCSNQTTAGVPLPSNDFYQFGVSHRCVYPPHTCNSGFCDNPAVPDLASQTCHKPYVFISCRTAATNGGVLSHSVSFVCCESNCGRDVLVCLSV